MTTPDPVETVAKAIYHKSEEYPRYALAQMNNHLAKDFARAALRAVLLAQLEGARSGGAYYHDEIDFLTWPPSAP